MKRHMIRYMLLCMLSCTAAGAFAWNGLGERTIAAFAQANLTPEAEKRVTELLGGTMEDNASWLGKTAREERFSYIKRWKFVHLDASLQYAGENSEDCVAQIERAAETLRRGDNDSLSVAALRTLINLVGKMHSPSYYIIDGTPMSKQFPEIIISNGKKGKKEEFTHRTWAKYWDNLLNRHRGFSVAMYVEDLGVCYGDMKEAYSAGGPRDWASDMGRECTARTKLIPDIYMSRETDNRLEPIGYKCVAKAGFRLAALLNGILK